jgi:putative glycosyltransferase (TIGR04372 family)
MTFLLAFLTVLGVLCLVNLALVLLLVRLRGRKAQLLRAARAWLGECLRRRPSLRLAALFVYRLIPSARSRLRARYLVHLCRVLVTQDSCEAAVAQCGRALDNDPLARDAYILRGTALRRLGRTNEALQDFQCALALPHRAGEETQLLYYQLARLLLSQENLDLALVAAYAHLAIMRGNPAPTVELRASFVPQGADQVQILIEAHNDLAEEVINTESNFETALEIYARKAKLQQQYRKTYGLEKVRTLYLPDDWVRNIGHLALLDFWIKMKQLGWGDWDEVTLLAPQALVANPCYLDYWKKYFTVVSDPHLITALTPLAQALGHRVAGRLVLPDGKQRYFCDAMGLIQQEWEQQHRSPLMELSEQDRARGRQCLSRMGVPRDAWFVVLHVRSPGFHREGSHPHQAHRNANIRTYLPAIEDIVARGGWVIRLGDPSMEPLPPLAGVVDYAHSREKCDWMDVFLISQSRFFLGVASGLCNIPQTFGVPCVLTNWVSNHLPVYGRCDLFIPKLCWSDREQRLLSFDEFYHPMVRRLSYSCEHLAREGLRVLDNSPEEILAVVQEMCDTLDGIQDEDPTLQDFFRAIVARHGLAGYSRMGREFLRAHADLLPGHRRVGHRTELTQSALQAETKVEIRTWKQMANR